MALEQRDRPDLTGIEAARNTSLGANSLDQDRRPVVLRARLVVDLIGLSADGANRRLREASMDARPGCEVVLRVPPGYDLPTMGINALRQFGRHASVVIEAPDTVTGEAWLRQFAGDPWEVA